MRCRMRALARIATVSSVLAGSVLLYAADATAFAVKDQSRLPGMDAVEEPGGGTGSQPLAPLGPLVPKSGEEGAEEPRSGPGDDQPSVTVEEIPSQQQVPLTEDSAKRAVDAFIKLKASYQDTEIAEYETLEQFVAEAKEGAALEADIKSFGFASVGEWNNTIMSVSFAYAAVASTQEQEILQELENIRDDASLDAELKKSLIESLQSMLPSDENKNVVRKLNEDKVWAEKLKALSEDESGVSEH